MLQIGVQNTLSSHDFLGINNESAVKVFYFDYTSLYKYQEMYCDRKTCRLMRSLTIGILAL